MNHAVVSLLNGEPAKVRCRTCHNDHDYRHEQPPPPKVDTRKQTLFNEVLAKVAPGSPPSPPSLASGRSWKRSCRRAPPKPEAPPEESPARREAAA